MKHYHLTTSGIAERTEEEALAASALMPGELAKRLYNRFGLARRFYPIRAWFVNGDNVSQVKIVEVRGADVEYLGAPDYALTEDGRLLPTFYLFPVDRHLKPRLLRMRDEMGYFTQWAAPLKPRCMAHWSKTL